MNIDCDFGNVMNGITDDFLAAYREALRKSSIYFDTGIIPDIENKRKKYTKSISLENEDSDTSNALDEFLSEFAIKKSEVSQY